MNRTDSPKKQPVPFAVNGQRENILNTTPAGDNTASYDAGFPAVTMILKAAGGLPPKGQDMNQILYELSLLARWSSAGALNTFDSAFATGIGGYPKGSILLSNASNDIFISTVDANTNDPNSVTTGWLSLLNFLGGSHGRLTSVQSFTASGTYTPSAGVKSIIVEIIGAGGGSGGLGGTGTNQVVISAGGGSGTYARVLISNPSQTSITVGTGGAGGLGQNGATGGRGGSSVFGSFVTVEGGFGSSVGLSKAMPAHGIPTSVSPQFTYSNCSLMTFSYGGAGTPGFVTANGDAVAGAGGTSFFGLGGDGSGNKGTGKPGMSPGSGGGGVCVSDSSYGQTTTGSRGADGICVIWEYS